MTALNWDRARDTWTPPQVRIDTVPDFGAAMTLQRRGAARTCQSRITYADRLRQARFEELRLYVERAAHMDSRNAPAVQMHEMQRAVCKLLARCSEYRTGLTPEESVLVASATEVLRRRRH